MSKLIGVKHVIREVCDAQIVNAIEKESESRSDNDTLGTMQGGWK